MKTHLKRIIYILTLSTCFAGCKTPVAQQSGKEDIAFLLFISQDEYAGKEVTVYLDNKEPFSAEVVKEKKSKRKGTQYGVKTGPRRIKVTYNGKVLYNKKIFVSPQEVKQIILP